MTIVCNIFMYLSKYLTLISGGNIGCNVPCNGKILLGLDSIYFAFAKQQTIAANRYY